MDPRQSDLSIEELRTLNADYLRRYVSTIRPRYREKDLLEDATRENEKVIQYFYEILDTDMGITAQDLSKLEYEQGYIEFLKGNYERSVDYFEKSAENALKAEDLAGAEVGKFRVAHTRVFAQNIDLQDAYTAYMTHLENLLALYQKTASPLAKSFIMNIRGRLLELAVDMGNVEEAELRYSQFLEDDRAKELEPGSQNRDNHMRLKLSYEGSVLFLKQDYETALKQYALFLDVDLSEWGEQDVGVVESQRNSQENARDYLYAGQCLLALDMKEKAKEVFDQGMSLDPIKANHFYQSRIDLLLDQNY